MIGGIIHAWRSQSWPMHMFEIIKNDINITKTTDDNINYNYMSRMLYFTKGSGKQVGRNWCRCDQCTYAGNPYCKQYQKPIPENTDQRLIIGTRCVENILSELDLPNEFYFNKFIIYISKCIINNSNPTT